MLKASLHNLILQALLFVNPDFTRSQLVQRYCMCHFHAWCMCKKRIFLTAVPYRYKFTCVTLNVKISSVCMLGIHAFYSSSEVPCLWFLSSSTSACHSTTCRVGLYGKSAKHIPHRLKIADHMHVTGNVTLYCIIQINLFCQSL